MNPSGQKIPFWALRGAEWVLALVGAVICVGVAILVVSLQPDNLWPAPGIYLLELILLGMLALASRAADRGGTRIDYGAIPWVTGGVLLAFVILAGFSIGPLLFPAMLAFWLAAIAGDLRQNRAILPHLGIALIAAVFQAGIIGLFPLLTSSA